MIRAYVGERANRRHKPGRALERLTYRFDVLADYGAFRDLQRHRMLTIEWQALSPRHGYTRPEAVDLAGAAERFDEAMERSASLHDAVAERFPAQAAYAVSLAYKVRFYLHLNAREAMHLLELRTTPQGHPAYRVVGQEMHRLIAEQAGHRAVAEAMRYVDHSPEPSLERLDAERRAEAPPPAASREPLVGAARLWQLCCWKLAGLRGVMGRDAVGFAVSHGGRRPRRTLSMRAQRSSSSTIAVVGLAFLALLSTSAHTVRAGETLAGIAAANRTTVAALASREPPRRRRPDLRRPATWRSPAPAAAPPRTYKVRSGDTLGLDRVRATARRVGRGRAAERAHEPQPDPDRPGAEGPGGPAGPSVQGSSRRRHHPRRAGGGDPRRASRPATASRWPRSWRPTGSPATASTSASSSAWCRRPAPSRRRPAPTRCAPATRCPPSPEVRHHRARAPGRQRHPRRQPGHDRSDAEDPGRRHRRRRRHPLPGAGRRHGS